MANLEAGRLIVEGAIKKTETLFNKKAVAEAGARFSEYAGEAERTVTELQHTASSQANQILNLNRAGEDAAKKLQEAQAKIAYQQTEAEAAKQLIVAQEGVIKKVKKRTKIGDPEQLENGNILYKEAKWNHTELHVEKTPEGRKVRYNVVSADKKAQRGGTFDEITQRRLSTTTKTPKGETTITYDLNGKADNIINQEVKLPKLVHSDITSEGEARVLTERFEDGTTVVTKKGKNDGVILKTDKNNKRLEQLYEHTDDYKTTTKHYKYINNVPDIEEITETARNTDRMIVRFKAKKAIDIEGKSYNSEATIERENMILKGKVSKIDKFGDLEEYTYKADINPAVNYCGVRYKSVEGRCGIVKNYQGYGLIHKELNVTTADGHKYNISFDTNGKVKNIKSLTGGRQVNLDGIMFYLKPNELMQGI